MLDFPKKALLRTEEVDDYLTFNFIRNLINAGHETSKFDDSYGEHKVHVAQHMARIQKIFPSRQYMLPSRTILFETENVMVITTSDWRTPDEKGNATGTIWFRVIGEKGAVAVVVKAFQAEFKEYRTYSRMVEWKFMAEGQLKSRMMTLINVNPCKPELYPWISKTPDEYIEDYLKSDASTLLLLGPPGTGKTSFIRHLLCHFNLSGILTYDPELLTHDSFYLDFISSNRNVLIIEDADELLLARKLEGNKNMKRFLNVGDGVVRFSRKKIVFTTNLHFEEVDPALTRPGRCFGVLKSRFLTRQEAETAAQNLNLSLPADLGGTISLAEIFNPGVDVQIPERPNVGFLNHG